MSDQTLARLRMAGILLVSVLLETTIAPDLRIDGVAPDFMLLLAVCGGMAGGPEQGAYVGFFAGMLADVFVTDTPFGLSALALCLVGYGVGQLRANVLPSGWVLTPFVTMVGTVAGVLVFVGVGDLVGQSQLIGSGRSWLLRVALVEAVFNAVLSVPISRLFDWAARGSRGAEVLGAGRPERVSLR